jgi:transposase
MVPALPDNLPTCHDEIKSLFARTVALSAENQSLSAENQSLSAEKESLAREMSELAARLAAESARTAEMNRRIEWFEKQFYGAKSERRPGAPTDVLTEDLFGKPAEATPEEIREETSAPSKEPRRRRSARKPLPADLDRREILHDVEPQEKLCACCGKEKVRIGEDVTEQLEVIPAQVYVARHVRPKYACSSCKDGVAQAALPAQPAPRASVGAGFLAWLIVSKYADHLPLCRLERIFARHGVDLPRARMCDWLMTVAVLLGTIVKAMANKIVESNVIQADETSIRLQSKEKKGKTDKTWVWVYVGDETRPYTVYDFQTTRGRDGPRKMLDGFTGCLQSDAYTVYEHLKPEQKTAPGGGETPATGAKMTRGGCWAHARRKFVETEESGDTRASIMIRYIKELYKTESEWKASTAAFTGRPEWKDLSPEAQEAQWDRLFEERRALRQEKSEPVIKAMYAWMAERLDVLPKSPLGVAIGYAQNQESELKMFLKNGRLEIDNNAAERALRPIAVGRKNWLFAGSERGGHAAATFFTLIESCRRNGVNPYDYLRDVLTRLPSHPINRIDEFLPDRWEPPKTD